MYKAISPDISEEGVFTEVEILKEENGRPYVILHGELKKIAGDKNIEVSLSHEKEYAIANVIIE